METTSTQCTNVNQQELPDRIKWDIQFDAKLLQNEVKALLPQLLQQHYIYYNVVPLRAPRMKASAERDDTNPIDYSDPSLYDWIDGSDMQHCPYIKSIADSFETKVTNIRLMRLEAGANVKEHSDPTLDAIHRSVVRLIIPIISTDESSFYLNRTLVPMKPGEAWYMRLSNPHAAFNNSLEERINLSIDLVYNDWLDEKLRLLASV